MNPTERPVAIVTGAGKGIGKTMAEQLHAKGYAVAVTDINMAEAESTARALCPRQESARPYRLDVASVEEITQVFGAIERDMGTPSALINNAGVFPNRPALDIDEALWDRVFDINLKGSFFCIQAFARQLIARKARGSVVNMATTAAFSARPGAAPYSASKAAVVMLTKSLAQEFGDQGIRVNAVAPGLIEVREGLVNPAYRDQFVSHVPSGRIGQPADISGVVAFLLSKEADYVNGECIVIDGGFLTGRILHRSSV